MLGLELSERVPVRQQSTEASLTLDAAHASLPVDLVYDDLVAGPDPEPFADTFRQHNLALGADP